MSTRIILIDDEPLALKRLHRLLEKHNNRIEIVAEATDGAAGLKAVEEHRPDLIFLDVEMPVMNGFEMLSQLKHIPKIIFTTAFEEYAIKAFEENSIDYLLKPIDAERLDKAIEKFNRFSKPENIQPDQISNLLASMQTKKEIKSIPVKIGDRFLLINTSQIVFMEAKDKYVYLVTDDNNEYLTDFTLAALEEKLSTPFLRIHRAYMINADKIREVHKGFNGSFIFSMKDQKNTKINSGRSYNETVKKIFEL
jgi:two-component system, LytTR family, response regulator